MLWHRSSMPLAGKAAGCARTLVVLGCLLMSHPARGQGVHPRVEGEVGFETPTFGTPALEYLGVAMAMRLASSGLELVGGGRVAWGKLDPNPGVAGFVRASLSVSKGPWNPALGLELEATSATRIAPDRDDPEGSLVRRYADRNRDQAIRIGGVMAPLRCHFGRVFFSLLNLRIATPLSHEIGHRVYLAMGVATLGWSI